MYTWERVFASGSVVKNPSEMKETLVLSLRWEDLLEEGMATHSNILAWRIPWREEPRGYSPHGCKELDTTEMTELSGTQYMGETHPFPNG